MTPNLSYYSRERIQQNINCINIYNQTGNSSFTPNHLADLPKYVSPQKYNQPQFNSSPNNYNPFQHHFNSLDP